MQGDPGAINLLYAWGTAWGKVTPISAVTRSFWQVHDLRNIKMKGANERRKGTVGRCNAV